MEKAENAKTVLAVIVPCYNEEAVLNLTNATFLKILEDMIEEGIVSDESHICYINDGSIDKSWDMIMEFM
ncbi:MAG: glycosyltransferase, partial [Mucispirillum sp.]|nr:glycosyltransferase [Mucispirillum sp.]